MKSLQRYTLVSISLSLVVVSTFYVVATPPIMAQGGSCESADLNKDGKRDRLDYSILVNNFFKNPTTLAQGDLNGDTKTDVTDYSLFASFFLKSCASATPTTTPQPRASLVKAFPEAQGYGAMSKGGRGGRVIEVTNLNDSGTGSLRAALEATGPRIIVFRVAGKIQLNSAIGVRSGNFTLAGQTAPGGGITLAGVAGLTQPLISYPSNYGGWEVNDTIIRYIRMRHGSGGVGKIARTNLIISTGKNHIVDHSSFSWTQSNLVSISRKHDQNAGAVENITLSRNILSEAFWDHPTGILIYGNHEDTLTTTKDWHGLRNIDLHHNAFAHVGWRTPEVSTMGIRICNNIQYNFSYRGTTFKLDSQIDFCGNTIKAGPMSPTNTGLTIPYRHDDAEGLSPSIYISDNRVLPPYPDPSTDNWKFLGMHRDETATLPISWRRSNPLAQSLAPLVIESSENAFNSIVADVGANKRLDCRGNWVINQDVVDQRIVNDIKTGKGYKRQDGDRPGQGNPLYEKYVTGQATEPGYGIDLVTGTYLKGPPVAVSQVGGYPNIDPGVACKDTDHDAMPDEWETLYQFTISDPTDGPKDTDGDGYTNVEEYLNGTNPRG